MAIPAHRDVAGDLEVPEGAAALGVRLALGDPLAVEVVMWFLSLPDGKRPVRPHSLWAVSWLLTG
jgi:hypothetical protein